MNAGILRKLFLAFFLVLFFTGRSVSAQSDFSGESAEDNIVLKLAVIGPGDELYFWWGHIGLIIEDHLEGTSRFYDWGIFSFENKNFFANFALGRLLYTCGASSPGRNIENYIYNNRDVTLYTLDLPAGKKAEVKRYAEWTILPENKDYYYHHFRDNCATRIRDILDMALDGQFKARYGAEKGRFTLREHVRRHTWFNPFFDWLLCFLMGRWIDRPVTIWEEMFLPSEIASRIGEFVYVAPSGIEKKLVSSVEYINTAVNRPAVLDKPRRQWPAELALGLGFALFFITLLILRRPDKIFFANIWAIGQGVAGLFFGAAGTVLFFMMFFTNHDYTFRNINILFANPALLAALPLGMLCFLADNPEKRYALGKKIKILWSLVFCFGLLSIPLDFLPFFGQKNQVDLAFFLPIAAALSFFPDALVFIFKKYFHVKTR